MDDFRPQYAIKVIAININDINPANTPVPTASIGGLPSYKNMSIVGMTVMTATACSILNLRWFMFM